MSSLSAPASGALRGTGIIRTANKKRSLRQRGAGDGRAEDKVGLKASPRPPMFTTPKEGAEKKKKDAEKTKIFMKGLYLRPPWTTWWNLVLVAALKLAVQVIHLFCRNPGGGVGGADLND